MKVLYVNHTGTMSGAERSLLDLLQALPVTIETCVACPPGSPLADALRDVGCRVAGIPGTEGSLRLHPRETPRALAKLGAAAAITAIHVRRMKADLMHANSIRAGLITGAAAALTGIPSVAHVRDRLPRSRTADASLRLLVASNDLLVANSHYTAEGLRAVTDRGRVTVIHNAVDLSRFNRAKLVRHRDQMRPPVGEDSFVLGVIGQVTPWKGQREAIQSMAELQQRGSRAHLLIVGEPKFVSRGTRYDNEAYYGELKRLIGANGLADRVQLLGERDDVAQIMATLDAVLVPSWEEPFGRVVIEAMALGIPVLATSVGGPTEIIRDGIDGILLPPRAPSVWTEAIARLESSPEQRVRLGKAAMDRAKDFSVDKHVAATCTAYRQALTAVSTSGVV